DLPGVRRRQRRAAAAPAQPRPQAAGLTQAASDREHGAGTHAGSAVDLREADAAAARDLPLAGLAPPPKDDLVNLGQPGGADRVAVGQAAAVGVDRQPARDRRRATLDQRLLLAVPAKPG